MDILAISGSLRAGSYNRGLLRAAAALAPAGMRVEITEIGHLPLFNEDLEKPEWPAAVRALRERAYAADGILFGTPEYNYGIPGPLKNAFDWLSRPEGAGGPAVPGRLRNPFFDKPCAMLGASVGMAGTVRAQLQLRQSLQLNGALTMPGPEVFCSFARDKFDAAGKLTDAGTEAMVTKLMAAFADWARRMKPQHATVADAPPREAGGPKSQ